MSSLKVFDWNTVLASVLLSNTPMKSFDHVPEAPFDSTSTFKLVVPQVETSVTEVDPTTDGSSLSTVTVT